MCRLTDVAGSFALSVLVDVGGNLSEEYSKPYNQGDRENPGRGSYAFSPKSHRTSHFGARLLVGHSKITAVSDMPGGRCLATPFPVTANSITTISQSKRYKKISRFSEIPLHFTEPSHTSTPRNPAYRQVRTSAGCRSSQIKPRSLRTANSISCVLGCGFFLPALNSISSRRDNRFPHALTRTANFTFFSAGRILVIPSHPMKVLVQVAKRLVFRSQPMESL